MNPRIQPFEQSRLDDLIRTSSAGHVVSVSTREGSTKEFKENFTWGSIGLYARTMAGFANARGGYLIFGVSDNPRQLVGLGDNALSQFDNLDQAKLTQELNELFSPELHWEIFKHQQDGKSVGLLYVHESENKPVIARKSHQQHGVILVEGDIVYRYNSRTERIKYPELLRLLDDAKSREQKTLMRHFEELVRVGAANSAILDFSASTLKGPNGQSVLIDRSLLDQISFIREGEFDEVKGSPTLRVVGDVKPATTIAVGPASVIKGALSSEDVLEDFFNRKTVVSPEQYVRVVATGATSLLPIQFYRSQKGWSDEELLQYIDDLNTRSSSRKRVADRLRSRDKMQTPPPAMSQQYPSTVQRRAIWTEFVNGNVDDSTIGNPRNAQYFAEAVKSLSDEQVAPIVDELMPAMYQIFKAFYSTDAKVAEAIRRAACRIDAAMYSST